MLEIDNESRQYLLNWIHTEVRGGFTPEEDLLESLKERVEDEFGRNEPELVEELRTQAVRLLTELRQEESNWNDQTTNDAIDQAFVELRTKGIVAIQNAGYTMSEGWEDVNEEASSLSPVPRGAVFYHGQDLERGVEGQGLMLAFGAYEDDTAKQSAASLDLAREVIETLARHGVHANWNGTVEQRISIPPFEWRKRRWTKAP